MTPATAPQTDRPAVLYVDDEEQALKYFRRGLERDMPVLTAVSPAAAIALLEEKGGQIGVVISDQRMPGRTGVSLLSEVRQRWPAIVRVLITAYTDIDSAVSAVNAGSVYKYVHKPADFPALRQTLTEALAVHREAVHRDEMGKTLAALEDQRRATEAAEGERAKLHGQLVAASREAGRAEVATGILHNVGNVLNSMNVSASVVQATLANSRLSNLCKGLEMFGDHAADLAAFLTTDERGRRLPGYLLKLSGVLAEEQRAIADAMASLGRNIEHVTQVVRSQQAHAKHVAVRAVADPAALMAEAVRLAGPAVDRHGVNVVTAFDPAVGPVSLDQHRVLQILVNLVANAVNAVAEGRPAGERRVTVSVAAADHNGRPGLDLAVTDNGVGIAAADLTRIFTFGFTTRAEGHGFGLHSAANAAKEMGGALAVSSDGPGQGATFRLTLPIEGEQTGTPTADPSAGKAMAA